MSPPELQAAGIEASRAGLRRRRRDPQVAHRDHFIELPHPEFRPGKYERNGFRLSGIASGYDRSGPTLGQDNVVGPRRSARAPGRPSRNG